MIHKFSESKVEAPMKINEEKSEYNMPLDMLEVWEYLEHTILDGMELVWDDEADAYIANEHDKGVVFEIPGNIDNLLVEFTEKVGEAVEVKFDANHGEYHAGWHLGDKCQNVALMMERNDGYVYLSVGMVDVMKLKINTVEYCSPKVIFKADTL